MKLYDVTLPLSPRLPAWPEDPEFELTPLSGGAEGGDELSVSALRMGTHTGTHLDAPRHLFRDGATVDQLPLDSLVGEAWLCQLPPKLPLVTARALEAASIPGDVRRLLLKTGNGAIWDRSPSVFSPQYVALSPDAADWIVRRGLALVGIDYLSVDPFDSDTLPAHRTLLSHGVVVVEGLDLRGVSQGRYQLHCLPLRLMAADGAPARVLLRES